jgi:signal transduction histidine kinase
MLATLLAQPLPTAETRHVMWRQVVDVLAQGRGHHADDPLADAPRTTDAYNFLRSVRPEIPIDLRLAAGRGLAGRRVPPDLVLMFAEDLPHIAAPMLGHAILSSSEWLAVLPRLSPTARTMLRNRRDLGDAVNQALEHFGSSDLMIQGPEPVAEAKIAPLAVDLPAPEASAIKEVPTAPDATAPEAAVFESLPPVPLAVVSAPSASPSVEAANDRSESQIRDLLSRIENFRARKPAPLVTQAAPDASAAGQGVAMADDAIGPDPIESFRFETGVDGVICWIHGAPREPLIGETIAVAARQTDHGVDGHAAGAYRSRTPFRDARLTIAGDGPVAGEWRISAVPFFDPRDSRFGGYRGTARRPRPDETAKATPSEPAHAGDPLPTESLRHLAHELRTPLNAIIGFSEMIDAQVQGPAAAAYRSRAQDILEQGRKLLSAVEDLNMVAAAREAQGTTTGDEVHAAAILMRLHGDFEGVAKERASGLAFRIDPDLPPVAADGPTVERMLSRLLAATIAMSEPGERIAVDLQRDPRRGARMLLSVVRPQALAGRDEKMLLDPGYNPDGAWPDAPVLGLGFALRLVRNLAIACGGMLDIDSQRFYLSLPLRQPAVISGGNLNL